MQLAIQQSQQIVDNKINKIAQQLFAMMGQAMGRLQTVTPPGVMQPQLQATLPTGPVGGANLQQQIPSPTGPVGYTGPPPPINLQAGQPPPPLGGPIYQPGYIEPTGPTGGVGPAFAAAGGLNVQGGGQFVLNGPGPCYVNVYCFSAAIAAALAASISDAIINAVAVLFTGQSMAGVVIPGAQTPLPSVPQSQPTPAEKFRAENQWESGPSIETMSPDKWMFPARKDIPASVSDDEGNRIL